MLLSLINRAGLRKVDSGLKMLSNSIQVWLVASNYYKNIIQNLSLLTFNHSDENQTMHHHALNLKLVLEFLLPNCTYLLLTLTPGRKGSRYLNEGEILHFLRCKLSEWFQLLCAHSLFNILTSPDEAHQEPLALLSKVPFQCKVLLQRKGKNTQCFCNILTKAQNNGNIIKNETTFERRN